MEHITDIIRTICLSVMVATILYNFSSFPSMEKVLRFVISIYIIVNSVNVFSGYRFDFTYGLSPDESVDYKITEDFSTYVLSETEQQLEEMVKLRLENKNISYNDINLHILEQNGILTVDNIVIRCSDADVSAVRNIIEDMITEETIVIIGE